MRQVDELAYTLLLSEFRHGKNFSQISKSTGFDRRTVAKTFREGLCRTGLKLPPIMEVVTHNPGRLDTLVQRAHDAAGEVPDGAPPPLARVPDAPQENWTASPAGSATNEEELLENGRAACGAVLALARDMSTTLSASAKQFRESMSLGSRSPEQAARLMGLVAQALEKAVNATERLISIDRAVASLTSTVIERRTSTIATLSPEEVSERVTAVLDAVAERSRALSSAANE